jgi:hypothetical protein
LKSKIKTSTFIQSTMASSAINALNNFASAHIRDYIEKIVSGGFITEENAMRVFAEMDLGTVAPKRRTDVAIPGSPSGYTLAYLESVSGVVLRNIGQMNGITGIKQSGRQNKAEMVKIIQAHFDKPSTEASAEPDAPAEEPVEPKKKEKAKKEKPEKPEKEKAEPKKKEKKEKEKKKKESDSSSEDELRAEAVPKKKEKKEKEKENKKAEVKEEEDGIEAEIWESPNGKSFLRDKENNLYDKATQELLGTWDEDAEEVIPA